MTRRPDPDNVTNAKFWLGLGFWLLMAVVLAGAVYIGGLAQYGYMLVDPK